MKIVRYIALCLAFVFIAACTAVTFTNDNILPEGMRWRAYPVTLEGADAEWLGEAMPNGCLALADGESELISGSIAVIEDEGEVTFGVVSEDGEGIIRVSSGSLLPKDQSLGVVFYRIEGLGAAVSFIRENAMAVRVGAAAIIAVSLLWVVTIPSRRRKKEVRELIELFEYYGRKYDEEEEGIDY
ncbi:MAG: hypothetical protein IIW34_04145 [Clostridia bacterium]|nr:hypothetical protein [Clostridia bacterium]